MKRYVLYVLVVYVSACLAVGSAAGADTVRLANGHRIENVVTETSAEGVTIRYSYGEVRLPANMVAGVEKSESSLARFLARRAALEADRDVTAAAWLELAFAARADGLDDGYRRALLRAAALDPYWPPLAAPLRAFDYVLDDARGRWLPYQESASALALAAERETSRRAAAEEHAARARIAQRERLVETLEVALLSRMVAELTERRDEPDPRQGIPLTGPYVYYPGFSPAVGHGAGRRHGWADTEANRDTLRELTRRQPGSLLPVNPRRRPAPRSNGMSFKSSSGD